MGAYPFFFNQDAPDMLDVGAQVRALSLARISAIERAFAQNQLVARMDAKNRNDPMTLLEELAEAMPGRDVSVLTSSIVSAVGGAWNDIQRGEPVLAPEPPPVQPERTFSVTIDGRNRVHCATGPAIMSGEREEYYWHGVKVEEFVVMRPEEITARKINQERNQEARRVMIERFGGMQRYMQECGATLVHEDETGELYKRVRLPGDAEDFCFVKVKNSTAEPDGTFKDYFLRVPPSVITAKAGVAWTFGLQEKEYSPQVQT